MATAKTGTFYLTETVQLAAAVAAGGRVQGTVDLSAYVNVPTGQAIAIDSVDFIYQNGTHYGGDVDSMVAANGALTLQLTDLNPGTAFIRADGQSLIASGSLNIDQVNCIATHTSDIYPDNFGPGSLSESFMVVNDTTEPKAVPKAKAKRKPSAHNMAYSKAFKKHAPRFKKKSGGWKKDGFKRAGAAARKSMK